MCSLNCVHTLQRRLVAYSPFLSYCSQVHASKGPKDFSIQFSSTVLYFTILGTEEEDVFFVLPLFFALSEVEKQMKQQPKFASFSLVFPKFLTHNHFYALPFLYTVIFSVRLFYTKHS